MGLGWCKLCWFDVIRLGVDWLVTSICFGLRGLALPFTCCFDLFWLWVCGLFNNCCMVCGLVVVVVLLFAVYAGLLVWLLVFVWWLL